MDLQLKLNQHLEKARIAEAEGQFLKAEALFNEACSKCLQFTALNSRFLDVRKVYIDFLLNHNRYLKAWDYLNQEFPITLPLIEATGYAPILEQISDKILPEILARKITHAPLLDDTSADSSKGNHYGFWGLKLLMSQEYCAAEPYLKRAIQLLQMGQYVPSLMLWVEKLALLYRDMHRHTEAWNLWKNFLHDTKQNAGEDLLAAICLLGIRLVRDGSYRFQPLTDELMAVVHRLKSPANRGAVLYEVGSLLLISDNWSQVLKNIAPFVVHLKNTEKGYREMEALDSLVARARQLSQEKKSFSIIDRKKNVTQFLLSTAKQLKIDKNVDGMAFLAQLCNDISLGAMDNSDEFWTSQFGDSPVRNEIQVIAHQALVWEEKHSQAFFLANRFRSLDLCCREIKLGNVTTGICSDLLVAHKSLRDLIDLLFLDGPTLPTGHYMKVREAGERFYESAYHLFLLDPRLATQMGYVPTAEDLKNGIPNETAILDINVDLDLTIVNVITNRESYFFNTIPVANLNARDFAEMAFVWWKNLGPNNLNDQQKKILSAINLRLHEYMFCGLTGMLLDIQIQNVYFITDAISRSLPLQLAGVCSEHVSLRPGRSYDYFMGIMPVTFSSSSADVFMRLYTKRPSAIRKTLCFADPVGDLPGGLYSAMQLDQYKEVEVTRVFTGPEATLERFLSECIDSDVIIIDTHGEFNFTRPDEIRITFADSNLSLKDIWERNLFKRNPLIILNICEVGATNSGSSYKATGFPGALLAAGAACVIANSWPAEDILHSLLASRIYYFIVKELASPATAAFKAVDEIRWMSKPAALGYSRLFLDFLDSKDFVENRPLEYLLADQWNMRLEENDGPFPFADINLWGGVTVQGTGWSLSTN